MITVTAFPRSARQGTAFISTYRDITKDIEERKDQAEPTVTSLPKEIQDLLYVFSKLRADILPPHRAYDNTIPI